MASAGSIENGFSLKDPGGGYEDRTPRYIPHPLKQIFFKKALFYMIGD